jgi:hypothetical protein
MRALGGLVAVALVCAVHGRADARLLRYERAQLAIEVPNDTDVLPGMRAVTLSRVSGRELRSATLIYDDVVPDAGVDAVRATVDAFWVGSYTTTLAGDGVTDASGGLSRTTWKGTLTGGGETIPIVVTLIRGAGIPVVLVATGSAPLITKMRALTAKDKAKPVRGWSRVSRLHRGHVAASGATRFGAMDYSLLAASPTGEWEPWWMGKRGENIDALGAGGGRVAIAVADVIHVSRDDAPGWRALPALPGPLQYEPKLVVTADAVWATGRGFLYVTRDEKTWEKKPTPDAKLLVTDLMALPSGGLLLVSSNLLHRTDDGTTWTALSQKPTALAVDGNRVLMSTGHDLLESRDNGATWARLAIWMGDPLALGLAVAGKRTVIAGSGGVYELKGKKPALLRYNPAASPYNPSDVIIVVGGGLLVADESGVIEYR